MWVPLDHPDIGQLTLRSCEEGEAEFFADLLQEASTRAWAKDVSAVTSLGHLRLTSKRKYSDDTPAGCIWLSLNETGDVDLGYTPPHSSECVAERTCPPEEALSAIELLLIRMFEEHDQPQPDAYSTDKDRDHPRFNIGSTVRVIINDRNRTPRAGRVARRVWHYKHACWIYYLEEGGRPVKKRYLAEDLRYTHG